MLDISFKPKRVYVSQRRSNLCFFLLSVHVHQSVVETIQSPSLKCRRFTKDLTRHIQLIYALEGNVQSAPSSTAPGLSFFTCRSPRALQRALPVRHIKTFVPYWGARLFGFGIVNNAYIVRYTVLILESVDIV